MTKSVFIPTLAVAFRRCVLTMVLMLSPCLAYGQLLGNASFDVPAVTANTDSLRPTGATWAFTGQAGIRNNSAPNGSDGKQAAFLSAAPSGGNNNFGSVRQSVTLKPGTYFVRYLAAVKTPAGRPQPLQFYVNGAAVGSVLNPRYLTDTTTGGFEAGWTQPFVVSTAGSYELRFDATNATNYGTAGAPLYATAYIDNIIVASVPGALANAGLEAAGSWTLSSGATIVAATDAPEGGKVLALAASATAAQTISLPEGRYSLSVKLGKASVASGTLNVEIASNGSAAVTVASITATTAAEYRTFTTPGFALPSGNHVVTLRATGSSFSLDNLVLNDAAPDAANAGFETPVLASPSSATAAGTVSANPAGASWTFSGTGGQIQTNAGSSNTSAPRTIAGKQYLGLSGTGAIAQSLNFAGGTYVAIAQVAQGGVNVRIDGTNVARLSSSTLDFREVMSAPFAVTAGSHSLGFAVDTTFSPATPKVDEVRLLRVDTLPAVSITSPANGTVFQTGATVNITATASDVDGLGTLVIARTPAGGAASQLASGTVSPLSTSWSNASANTYTLTATATDSTGATNAASVTIRVNANPNTIASMSPSGPVVTSATAVSTTLSVTSATDSDGSVTKVEFLLDGTLVTSCSKTIPPATAPYTCTVSLAPRAAAYALTARVTDNDGGVTTTSAFSLRVNTAPTVSLAAACVAPCTAAAAVNLTATPVDSDGSVAKVEFYDGATLLGSKTAAPWTFAASGVASGSHSYTAKAFDNDGATVTSSAQAVTVGAAVPTLALTASCTAPCNAPASVALTATASNITGTISKVEFYDGATLLNSDTTSPYAFTATSVAAATHAYSAKVYVTGNTVAVATSATQNVRVNALPTVTLAASCVAPCANPATVNLAATPADSDGSIARVEFYDGANLLGSRTAAPWSYSHTSAATGSHTYTAKAFDDSGASRTSSGQGVTVLATAPASVALTVTCTAPCEEPATMTFTVQPTNIPGGPTYLDLYDGASWVGPVRLDVDAVYRKIVADVMVGAHSYTVRVGHGTGGETTSNSVNVTVAVPANWKPSINWIAPYSGAQTSLGGAFILTAAASDRDGSIARVQFFVDGTAVGDGIRNVTTGAYEYRWSPPQTVANYQVSAVATDNLGATTALSSIQLGVADTIVVSPPSQLTFFTNGDTGFAMVEIPTVVSPTPAEVQGPSWQWNANTYFAPWYVDLLEDGLVVDTRKYGFEKVSLGAGYFCDYTFIPNPDNTCIVQWPAPGFQRLGKPIGSYSYQLRVRRAAGIEWWSTPATIRVADSRPQLRASAIDGSSVLYQGAVKLELLAPAYTLGGTVTFMEGGQPVAYCQLSGGACSALWPSAAPGSHTVSATLTAPFGTSASATPITIQVLPNAIPVVSFVSPAGVASFRSPASVLARVAASDADGAITKVEFFGSSGQLLGVGTANGTTYDFQVPVIEATANNQSLFLRARATDNRGAVSEEAVVEIRVYAPANVSLDTSCAQAQCYAGGVDLGYWSNIYVEDIVQVRYLRDGQQCCTGTGGNLSAVDETGADGTHLYSVEMTTRFGEVITSTPVSITVLPNSKPTVTLLAPSDGAVLSAPATLQLQAAAADADGGILRVEFIRNGTPFGTSTALGGGQWGDNWYGLPEGVYTIAARAVDTRLAQSTSAPVTVYVGNPARAVRLLAPVDQSVYPAGQTIQVETDPATGSGTVARVELWRVGSSAGDTLLSSVSGKALNYALTLPTSAQTIGLYTVSIDASGLRARSPTVTLSVVTNIADPRYFVWTNFNAALKAGSKAAALKFLTPTAQDVYGAAIDLIMPTASTVVAGYSPIVLISDAYDIADYLVASTVNGVRLVSALRFMRMDDGSWRLDQL